MTHRSRVRGFRVVAPKHIVIWGKALGNLTADQFRFCGNNEEGHHVHWDLPGTGIILQPSNGKIVVVDFTPPPNATQDDHTGFDRAVNEPNTSSEIEVTVTNNEVDGQTQDPPPGP